ncbi:cytochrome P450 family protein [Medicago truncatula]|uniref:Cytochrome P450 family protein n=1 Tax=Medicago truncatula TaxID=3880 RepID=A0A072THQ7_MEDTR|nr:cytochrome P450 family protein [Medicago truncatula]
MTNVTVCYMIPKGWNVILLLRYLHTNPENFKDPICFDPERWNEPAKPGTYQVFGAGAVIMPWKHACKNSTSTFASSFIHTIQELINPNADIIHFHMLLRLMGSRSGSANCEEKIMKIGLCSIASKPV